jgi:hypothetical protein
VSWHLTKWVIDGIRFLRCSFWNSHKKCSCRHKMLFSSFRECIYDMLDFTPSTFNVIIFIESFLLVLIMYFLTRLEISVWGMFPEKIEH